MLDTDICPCGDVLGTRCWSIRFKSRMDKLRVPYRVQDDISVRK